MQTLEGLEMNIRQQIQAHVSPALGGGIRTITRTTAERPRKLKSTLGALEIATQQELLPNKQKNWRCCPIVKSVPI